MALMNGVRLEPYEILALVGQGGMGEVYRARATPQNKMAMDWSPAGRFVLYRNNDPKTNYDIWALPVEGTRKPFPGNCSMSGSMIG